MAEVEKQSSEFATRVEGANPVAPQPVGMSTTQQRVATSDDPFAAQRTAENDPFAEGDRRGSDSAVAGGTAGSPSESGGLSPPPRDRRASKEWDASKVPPSRFQKREGSLYATPGSRDGHVSKNKQQAYDAKLKEKGWK